jgi:hypothetical protein
MAEDTQNPAIQVSSGITAMLTGLWSAFATAVNSWRGLIGLALILLFILIYQGKFPFTQNNADVLSSVASLRKDIADLKASVAGMKATEQVSSYPTAIDPPRR